MERKTIIASGAVILEHGKLLVTKDTKDDFYKLPGGTVKIDLENLEEACHREVKEEINVEIDILGSLRPMILWKNPKTQESMTLLLVHYHAKIKNLAELRPLPPIREAIWLDIEKIRSRVYNVAPNINFLIERGEIS